MNYLLVLPESPALNGGDWLDLGTMECPTCGGSELTTDGDLDYNGEPTYDDCDTCTTWSDCEACAGDGLTSKDAKTQECGGCRGMGSVRVPRYGVAGRVPVVPTWTCPNGWSDYYGRHEPETEDPCSLCNGEGVVHDGWLALGAAGHEVKAIGMESTYQSVPASLSELVRVQAIPVQPDDGTGGTPTTEAEVVVFDDVDPWEVVYYPADWWDDGDIRCENITDQFSTPPNPGDLVWRIVERVTLRDPITEHFAAEGSPEWDKAIHAASIRPTVPLPQQVGWYQADDALRDEIERRRP